jgi:membrane-bound lytic murein transglycosylase B
MGTHLKALTTIFSVGICCFSLGWATSSYADTIRTKASYNPQTYQKSLSLKDSKLKHKVKTSKTIHQEFSNYRGWDYLVEKLRADGVSEEIIKKIYLNKKMPKLTTVYFKLKPREPHSIYSHFLREDRIKVAEAFIDSHKEVFEAAEKQFGVNRFVIASIMLVESHYGKNLGKELVINRLSRVASIADPDNIIANFNKMRLEDPTVTFEAVSARANYLENRFYPEVLALIEMAKKHDLDLLMLKGSSAGAFGIPQFLPSTFVNYAVDGNKDGHISLFVKEDAILSTASYLSASGWKNDAPYKHKEEVIWKYNHSEPYISTVLGLADKLSEVDFSE